MGEKKRRLAARQHPPAFDGRLLDAALRALQTGDRSRAGALLDRLEPALPNDPSALNAAGVLALQLGLSARAEALLRRAVVADGGQAAIRCHLAIALRRLGRLDEAIAEFEAALRLDAGLAEAHANLGTALLDRGDATAALASFERALAIRADFPDALNGRGSARLTLGQAHAAGADFERAAALDPRFHEAFYNLSRARVAAEPAKALESILAALELADSDAYWVQLEATVRQLDLGHPGDARVHEVLFRALGHPAVDPAQLVRPVVALALSHPAAVALVRALPASGRFDAQGWLAASGHARATLGTPLLQRLLEATVVPHLPLQRVLAAVRAASLDELSRDATGAPSLPLAAMAAIAQQGFHTEYVNDASGEEREAVAALREAIDRARPAAPLHWCALYACYRPLHTLVDAAEVAAALAATPLAGLARTQIAEPLEERRIAATIVAATPIADAVSSAVRAQYEANPYPRWQRVRRVASRDTVARFLRRRYPYADLDGVADAPADILIAGCGTGRQSVASAQRLLATRVLAVDLSVTSLAYATRKTRELGIPNVEYRQADLMELGALGERFDAIECTGVLHHLRDPRAGWQALLRLLAPQGVMRVGLYSETARRHVVRARELIAAEGWPPTPDGIRACRQGILARVHDDPLLARVARGADFYSLSGCRDLLFHVREARFTLPQVVRLVADLELRVIGFEFADDAASIAYRERFPDDPAQADFARWDAVERDRPDTFAHMVQFWVRRRRPDEARTTG